MDTGIFDDIVILEYAQGIAGPYATMQLADFGARVIKIEPLQGDWSRAMGPPFIGDDSAVFLALNRNKQSLALDTNSQEGMEILLQLITRADVLVVDLPPAQRQEQFLTYETLAPLNRQLVCCSITPFGEHGPLAEQPGAELILQAVSGYTRYVGQPGGEPVRLGADIAGINTALFVYQAIVAALLARQQQGMGQEVQVSQLGSLLATKTLMIAAQGDPDEWDGFHLAAMTDGPEHGWKTRDGTITFDFGTSPDGWQAFCRRLDLEHLVTDPRFVDWYRTMCLGAEAQSLRHEYEQGMVHHSAAELMALIRQLGGNAFPYLSYDALLATEQVQSLNVLTDLPLQRGDSIRTVGIPWQSSSGQPPVRSAPPRPGEHSQAILGELGMTIAQIQELQERQIVRLG